MATLLTHLKTWIEALEHYARALGTYTAVVDDFALKSRPAGRAVYRQALADAEGLSVDSAAEELPSADYAFDTLSQLESVRAALDAGADAALDPLLLKEATRQMSQTYSKDIETKASRLRAARDDAMAAARKESAAVVAAWAVHLSGMPPEEVARAFRGRQDSAAASLYAAILQTWLSQKSVDSGVVAALVEGAKDSALGLKPDDSAAIERGTKERAGLHPLQALGVTFGLTPGGEISAEAESAASAKIIDMTLPQADTAVRYDLSRLVDAQAAAKFGPIASMNSGLSYRLVERLRSITETEILTPAVSTPAVSTSPSTPVVSPPSQIIRTIDRGETYEELRPPSGVLTPDVLTPGVSTPTVLTNTAAPYSTIGAGPRPRVERLGELLEEAVFGGGDGSDASGVNTSGVNTPLGLRTFADPDRLLEDYDAQVDTLAPDFTLDELGQVLIARFTEEIDAWPPSSVDEFTNAVLGQRGSRDLYRTYIARAISEVAKRGAERQLLRSEASGAGAGALLFGARGPGARGARQEILLSQITSLRVSIRSAQKKLIGAYLRLDGNRLARGVFADVGVGAGQRQAVAAAAGLRTRVLELYKTIIDEAFYAGRRPARGHAAKAVEKGDTIEPRLSLKLYVLEHGGGLGL